MFFLIYGGSNFSAAKDGSLGWRRLNKERAIVRFRVDLMLRSVEVKQLFRRFVLSPSTASYKSSSLETKSGVSNKGIQRHQKLNFQHSASA